MLKYRQLRVTYCINSSDGDAFGIPLLRTSERHGDRLIISGGRRRI